MPTLEQQQALLASVNQPQSGLQAVNQAFQPANAQQQAALAEVNKQFSPTTFMASVPDAVPSNALNPNNTTASVLNYRNQLDSQLNAPNIANDIAGALTPTATPQLDATSFVTGLTPYIESFDQQIAKLGEQTSQSDQVINTLLQQLAPEAQIQQFQGLQQQAGIGQFQQELTNLNQELKSVRSQFENQIIREEQAPGGTALGALSRTNQIRVNQARMETPIIAAMQVAQGNLSNAQNLVTQMFNIQRDALGQQLQVAQDRYNQARGDLSKAEQTRLELLLTQEEARINEAKAALDDQQQAAQYITGLIQRGANPQDVARDIQQGITTQQALAKYGQFEAQLTPQEELEYNLDQARLANEIAELNSAGAGDTVDLTLLTALAEEYAATGKIPSGVPKNQFGLVSALSKTLPQQSGRIVDTVTGLPSQNVSAGVATDIADMKSMIDLLGEMEQFFVKGDSRITTGPVAGILGGIMPTANRRDFDTLRSEIIDLTLRDRTGAVINKNEIKDFGKKVPRVGQASFGPAQLNQLNSLRNTLSSRLDTYLDANGLDIVGYVSPRDLEELRKLEAKANQ